ncbi:MAG: aldo/keto reductase [Christensenellales bacterium]
MKYRRFGKTGIDVSEIGMGLEHLLDKDEQTIIDTIKAALEGGVTYFDCHPGHDYDGRPDPGVYEGYLKLGRALAGVRDRMTLSYIASCLERDADIAALCFEGWLRALGTDHTDVFILQFCDKTAEYDEITGENGLLAYAQKLRAGGKVRLIGISTHSMDIALRAIESGSFDMLMFPVNPAFDVLDDEREYHENLIGNLWDKAYAYKAEGKRGSLPRKSVYAACDHHGVALVAMKPFAGGFVFGVEGNAGFTPVSLISYALAQPGVAAVVPGCQNPEQIREILTYHTVTDEARDYSGAIAKSRWSVEGHCLYCNHCLPCPAGINIGQVNKLLNSLEGAVPSAGGASLDQYASLPAKASACLRCGLCESRCPFAVPVMDRMAEAERAFEQG